MNKLNCIVVCLFFVTGCLFEVQGQTNDTVVKEAEVFNVVEVMPEYIGGDAARQKFLADNVKYPKEIGEGDIEGTVLVSFVVETDGSITNVEVVKSAGKELDAEAVRVTKLMPKWQPAVQRGKPVRARFRMPIRFALN